MSLILFYDTETTGLPLFDQPSEDQRQPHIVEFAATLVDADTRASVASVHLVARPDGWEIPDEVAALHGLTTDRARRIGVDERLIVQTALDLARLADCRVGHSEGFDARIVRIGLKRFGFGDAIADEWKAMHAECTAVLAKPHVPGCKRFPKLGEAYRVLVGRELEEAHTAKADAIACAELYWAIKDLTAACAA